MKELEDVYYDYTCIEHDLQCLLQILEILEDYYDEAGKQETKCIIHIVKKNVEAGRMWLKKNNNRFDICMMGKIDITVDEE